MASPMWTTSADKSSTIPCCSIPVRLRVKAVSEIVASGSRTATRSSMSSPTVALREEEADRVTSMEGWATAISVRGLAVSSSYPRPSNVVGESCDSSSVGAGWESKAVSANTPSVIPG